jgi:hypothetical protein
MPSEAPTAVPRNLVVVHFMSIQLLAKQLTTAQFRRPFMTKIEGSLSNEFLGVKEALATNLDSGEGIGAPATVFNDSEPVVDIRTATSMRREPARGSATPLSTIFQLRRP